MARTTGPLIDSEPAVAAELATVAGSVAVSPRVPQRPSLPESHRTIPIHAGIGWFKKLLAFAGPGYLVAVRDMAPGHWAPAIGGGAKICSTPLVGGLSFIQLAPLLPAPSPNLPPGPTHSPPP